MRGATDELGLRPLSARSVAISSLLGFHPPALPVRALVRIGDLFGIPQRTMRVALTRMTANGDLISEDGVYQLTGRLLERQALQDESCSPHTRRWEGQWEIAVVTAPPRPLAERVTLRRSMAAHRLAELREGVWTRPANLSRALPPTIAAQCTCFEGVAYGDPTQLVASLWDLPAWSRRAEDLRAGLAGSRHLRDGFMITAAVLHHLLADPLLPPQLAPPGWPAEGLRRDYAAFIGRYGEVLRSYASEPEAPAFRT